MQEDNSQMFKVDRSQELQARQMPLFNKNTQIIKQGQRHRVVFGQMEEERRPLHEIVTPYLYKFAQKTAQIATQAGSTTYQAVKTGLIWVYNRFVNNVIPYAVQNLPKVLFVIKKGLQSPNINSTTFEVIDVDKQQYQSISHADSDKKGKTRVVIPLGTHNDKHFQQYLQAQKYQINHDFPSDDESNQHQIKQSFMMPSQSFQAICQEVQQSHQQLQMQVPVQRKAYKLNNCFIFELQGQNTVEYDMLDSIEKCKDAKEGYIIFPQQTLRKSIREEKSEELDPIGRLVQGKQEKVQYQEEREVDMVRNAHVQIITPPSSGQADLCLN